MIKQTYTASVLFTVRQYDGTASNKVTGNTLEFFKANSADEAIGMAVRDAFEKHPGCKISKVDIRWLEEDLSHERFATEDARKETQEPI